MIRLATITDSAHLVRIAEQAYSKYAGLLATPPDPLFFDYDAVARAGNTYVYEREATLLGMVTYTLENGLVVLRNLAVLPEFQGQGIGFLLAEFVEAEARRKNVFLIRLWTRSEMSANIEFYCRLGYRVTHTENSERSSRTFFEKELKNSPVGKLTSRLERK
jgi:ribosomal protein S18 acetylase RimI-like enzyme